MNSVFAKTMENARKHKDIKLVTTEARRNYLEYQTIYHTIFFFRKFTRPRNERNTDTLE